MEFEILDTAGNGNVSTIILRDGSISDSSPSTMRVLYKSSSDSMYNSDFVEYDFKYKPEKENFRSGYSLDLLSPEFKSILGNNEEDLYKFEKAIVPIYDYSSTPDSRLSYISSTIINDKTVFVLDIPESYDEIWMADEVLDPESFIGSSATNQISPSQFQFKVILDANEKKVRNVICLFIGARDDITGLNLGYRAWQENPDPSRFKHRTVLRNDEYLGTLRGLNKIWSGSSSLNYRFTDSRSGSLLGSKLSKSSHELIDRSRYYFTQTFITKIRDNEGNSKYIFPWSSTQLYGEGDYVGIVIDNDIDVFRSNTNFSSNLGNNPVNDSGFKSYTNVTDLNVVDYISPGCYDISVVSGAVGSPIPSSSFSGILEVALSDFDGYLQTIVTRTQETITYQRKVTWYGYGGSSTSIYRIKGHVASPSNLPSNPNDGDAYIVDSNNHVYRCRLNGSSVGWVDSGVFQLVFGDWEVLSGEQYNSILSKTEYWEYDDTLDAFPIFPWSEYVSYRKGDYCYYRGSVFVSLRDNMGKSPRNRSVWVLDSDIDRDHNYNTQVKLYSYCEYSEDGETKYDYDTADFKDSEFEVPLPEVIVEDDSHLISLYLNQKPGYELDLSDASGSQYPHLVSSDFGEDDSQWVDSWSYRWYIYGNQIRREIKISYDPLEYGDQFLQMIRESGRVVVNTIKVTDCYTQPELYFVGDSTKYEPYQCNQNDHLYNQMYFGRSKVKDTAGHTYQTHPFPGLFDTEGVKMVDIGSIDKITNEGDYTHHNLRYRTTLNSDFESTLEFYTRNTEDEFNNNDSMLVLDHIELESIIPESTDPILNGVTSENSKSWFFTNRCNIIGKTNKFRIYVKCRDLKMTAACNISEGIEFSKVNDTIPYGPIGSQGSEYILSFILMGNYNFDEDSEGRCIVVSGSFGAYKGEASFTKDQVDSVFSDQSLEFTDDITLDWPAVTNPVVKISSRVVDAKRVIDITFPNYHYDTNIMVNIKESSVD